MRNGAAMFDMVERNSRTITSANLSQELLTSDTANIKVESKEPLDFKINDYITIDGSIYRLNQLPSAVKNAEGFFAYDLVFEGVMYDLKRCKFFNADINDFKTELEFPLIGDLEFFLTVVRNNMRRFSIDWEVGNFPTNTETKSLTFSSDNCLSALQRICQEYNVEFWIKQENGKFKIHTGSFGTTIPTDLEYGKGNGLYSLSRKNVNENEVVSRLYVNGGSTNIPNEYRGFSKNLLMPTSAYLEDTALISEIGLIEGSITFEEIYPKRTGVISALGNSVFKFVDSSMDFDLNEKEADGITTKYLISGTSAKIHFNTGNLAGYQFEIKKGGYDHATKTFEIIPFTNEQGQKFPDENSQAFQFSVGDEYKILDIYMPQSYITNAENELLAKATEQFNLLKQPKVAYDLEVDSSFISSLATPISIGDYVRVKDSDLGVDKLLRVQSISKNLITNEVDSIVIADAYEVNYASKLILDIKEIKNVVNITKLGEINYSKLGLKTTEELKNLVFDTDGYFDSGNIKPFSIETNMLSVGSRSQQLSLSSVFRINQDGNANKIDVTAGVLFSQTLDKTWNVSALVSTIPDNDYRYVYAKASKTTLTASIYLSKSQIPFDSDVNDFYFLVGILHSVVDGVRVLSITIGTTTISGGLVRTGIISSLDGTTTFNLNTGEITGKITFSSGSSGYANLTDKPDLSSFEQTRDYVNSTLQTDLNDLKNRADGVIESWFYSHTPTLSNLPASNWVTTEERNAHIGDTFTNMQEFVDNVTTPDAGKAWRFVKNETTGEFYWSLIANSDSTKALIEAGKAKDTADAKRRVFVSQPYPPYNVGDLWVQGNNGDIMRCKFERLSGTYVATDFEKASKYTDDTVANLAAESAQSALSAAASAQTTADGKIKSFYQNSAPTTASEGDIWFDTDDGNKVYTRRNNNWVETRDSGIAAAINSAQTAQTTADGKANVFYQSSEPTGMTPEDKGDIWIDLDDNNKMYIYSGSAWVLAQDYYYALQASQDYADRLAELTKIRTDALIDGIISNAERLAITAAENALTEAYKRLLELNQNLASGGVQLLREYDIAFNFKYWGGTGTAGNVDVNNITVIEAFAMGGLIGSTSFDYVDENGKKLEIIY